MSRIPLALITVILLAGGTLPGQQTLTADLPGPNAGPVTDAAAALIQSPLTRFQVVVEGAQLTGLAGATLRQVTFRHLNDPLLPIGDGRVRITLVASTATTAPWLAGPDFDGNHGSNRAILFDGTIHFQQTTVYGGTGLTPWGDRHNLTIPLTTPFLLEGADLCLEAICRREGDHPLPEWFARGLVPGQLPQAGRVFGAATTGAPASLEPRIYGIPGPGETFPLATDGLLPGTPALLVLGQSRTAWGPFPLPLTAAWSAGNPVHLLVSPDLVIPTLAQGHPPVREADGSLASPQPANWSRQGFSQVNLGLPWSPNLTGATVYGQWFGLTELAGNPGVPMLASSPGVEITMVSSDRHLGLAWLFARSDDPGQVPDRDDGLSLRFAPEFRLTATR